MEDYNARSHANHVICQDLDLRSTLSRPWTHSIGMRNSAGDAIQTFDCVAGLYAAGA